MAKSTVEALPESVITTNSLHDLLRTGTQQLIASTVEAELAVLLSQYVDRQLEDGRQAVVRVTGFCLSVVFRPVSAMPASK